MGTLLKIVGGIWAIIGIVNIALMPWANTGETLLGFGFIFNGAGQRVSTITRKESTAMTKDPGKRDVNEEESTAMPKKRASRQTDPRTLQSPSPTRIVRFPASMDDILVLNFARADQCWAYVGKDENGNKIYKQVTCPWDTIVFTDDDE